MGHVFPESHTWEKLDHLGIVSFVYINSLTAVLANNPEEDPTALVLAGGALLVSAFLPPRPRTLAIATCVLWIVGAHWHMMTSAMMLMQLLCYVGTALCFWHNAGHHRGFALSDHHFLHYFSTLGSILHVLYILNAESERRELGLWM